MIRRWRIWAELVRVALLPISTLPLHNLIKHRTLNFWILVSLHTTSLNLQVLLTVAPVGKASMAKEVKVALMTITASFIIIEINNITPHNNKWASTILKTIVRAPIPSDRATNPRSQIQLIKIQLTSRSNYKLYRNNTNKWQQLWAFLATAKEPQ